ncbi:MAG TPA: amino acid adenylation domain-containing protein, partial [Puia sp.]|nr:amino acid adenylation domain-containing protein [Puia sp.]
AWLQAIQEGQLRSREYQYSSLSEIQRWIDIPGDLFDSLLVFENYPVSEVIASRQWAMEVGNIAVREQVNYPLGIIISAGEEISIRFSYNSDVLEETYIGQIKDQFEHVLLQLPDTTAGRLKDLDLLTDARRHQLLFSFNDTAVDYPVDGTILDLFESQVERTPDAIALIFEQQQLTYGQLNEQANQLGHYLRHLGVREETLVPVCMERGLKMIIGMLGILKAGGAYVPIDPEYPEDRILYMIEDTGGQIFLSSQACRDKLPQRVGQHIILTDHPRIAEQPVTAPANSLRPENLAYVMYTSGSTGQPKGVMIEHRSVVNLVYSQVEPLQLRAGIVVFQFASFSFDASCYEIFCTLLQGGQLVMATQDVIQDPEALCSVMDRHQVELITLPPSYQSVIQDNVLSLRTMVSAGEMLPANLARHLLGKGIRLINAYGPTENTVCAVLSISPLGTNGQVTIGKPISNVQIYLLDRYLRPVEAGVIGEIYIGGLQVGRGYLNRPELTATRFITDPFSGETGDRMYRTGDLAKWSEDGDIIYVGRTDDQIKLRGYRIELGEVESVLQLAPGVTQAVVMSREDGEGQSYLVAYILPQAEFDKEEVHAYLRSRLPVYMVPAVLIAQASFPLTPSGKINRKALAGMHAGLLSGHPYVAPETPVQEKLAEIWGKLLQTDRIGIHDNFFELGGHSLLATRVIAVVRKEFMLELPIRILFEFNNISDLGKYIELQLSKDSFEKGDADAFESIEL